MTRSALLLFQILLNGINMLYTFKSLLNWWIFVQLGAFLAGALLAETNFRTQIEADIRPFRGLLLGLFFVTTGTSIDTQVHFYASFKFLHMQHVVGKINFCLFSAQLLFREWPNVLSLLAGLIVIKTLIITAIGPRVGLTLQESVRIGLLLSQGGEFGFVVFSLANRLASVVYVYILFSLFW